MSEEEGRRKRRREYRILDTHVVVVATEGWNKDWAAYIGAVLGKDYETESKVVKEWGTKLRKKVAEAIFPHWKDLDYRE